MRNVSKDVAITHFRDTCTNPKTCFFQDLWKDNKHMWTCNNKGHENLTFFVI